MSSQLVNLTPHTVNLFDLEGKTQILSLQSEGLARVSTASVVVGEAQGVSLVATKYGQIEGLPEPEEGKIFIVSFIVRQAAPHRTDLASPGQLIRDEKQQPIGCKGLDFGTTEMVSVHRSFLKAAAGAQGARAGEVGMDIGDYVLDDYAEAILRGDAETAAVLAKLMEMRREGVIREFKTHNGKVTFVWFNGPTGERHFYGHAGHSLTPQEAIKFVQTGNLPVED
jgi:hypothetical protein